MNDTDPIITASLNHYEDILIFNEIHIFIYKPMKFGI